MSYANSADPDQSPRFAVSDLGLHYLHFSPFFGWGGGEGGVDINEFTRGRAKETDTT